MLLAFFLFTPLAAAAPTQTFYEQSPNTALVATKAPQSPPEARRTIVRQQPTQSLDGGEYVRTQAIRANVSPDLAYYVWSHEGRGNLKAIGDMDITCSRTGKPVEAQGGWQITRCYHPEVTRACAFDLECSTGFALPLLKNKAICISQFSTCRDYYSVDTKNQ